MMSVRPSFLGQIWSSRLPSSEPSPWASSGICSTTFVRIWRWTDDLIDVCPEMSSLGLNLRAPRREETDVSRAPPPEQRDRHKRTW